MSAEPEPFVEPSDGPHDDSSAASRRRASAAYRASREGPIEVGGGAASESGTDEFSSTDGDDTFTSTMLKLLTSHRGRQHNAGRKQVAARAPVERSAPRNADKSLQALVHSRSLLEIRGGT